MVENTQQEELIPQKCFPEYVVFSTHWGHHIFFLPRLLDCTPTLTSFLAYLATRNLKLGMCTLISSLNTAKNCCLTGRAQPRSFYARQLWASSSRRKLCLMFSKFTHKVWNIFLFCLAKFYEQSLNMLFFFGHASWLMASQFSSQGLNPGHSS